MFIIKSTLETIQDNAQFVASDGTTYPSAWDKNTIPDLARLVETAKPQGVIITGQHIELIADAYTQVWEYRDKTEEEVAAELAASLVSHKELKRQAYMKESDPIFFKVQRGLATMQEWLDAVAAIDARMA